MADAAALASAGLISNSYVRVKLLLKGEVTQKLTVKLPVASQTAIAAIEQAGGSFEKVSRLGRPQTTQKTYRPIKPAGELCLRMSRPLLYTIY